MDSTRSKTTTDHKKIQEWTEERGGVPSMVKDTESGGGGILRIDFPGYGAEESLDQVSWDDFFKVFDDRGLAFLYQEETKSGDTSRFFKFVRADEE